MVTRHLLLASVGLLLLSLAPSVTLSQAPPANSSMNATCLGSGNWVHDAEPGQVACKNSIDTSYGTTTASALATTVGETMPGFTAISRVETNDELISPGLTYAYANIHLRYSFVIEEIAAPPFSVDSVPLTFRTYGSIDRSGNTNTWGFLGVMNSSGIFNGIEVTADTTSLDQERKDSYLLGIPYLVRLNFECLSSVDGPGASSCLASATALFVFNQALFDNEHGEESFTLSDYFSIELSPGLTAVPLPGAIGLFSLALSGLFFSFSRRAA